MSPLSVTVTKSESMSKGELVQVLVGPRRWWGLLPPDSIKILINEALVRQPLSEVDVIYMTRNQGER